MLLVASLALAAAPDAAETRASLLRLVEQADDLACLTPLVAQLHEHWEEFTPDEQARIRAILSPPTAPLFAPVVERVRPVPAKAAPPPAKDSCWSWSDNRVVGEHFVVEWEDGVNSDLADQWLEDLELSWEVQVDEYGWREADGSDKYLLVALIRDQRSGGAYTSVQSCGGESIPYMVSGDDSWNDPEWGATMAAHEFNHMLQFGYGDAPEFWWWEATATWVEDSVFPDSNYWSAYVYGYTQAPYISMSASDQNDRDVFNHMYGMAIFAFYLDDYQGGHDTVRQTWEDAIDDRSRYERGAEDMIEELDLDWQTVYADFVTKNTVMDYNQQRWFPEVEEEESVKSLPAHGRSGRDTVPQGYGQNFLKFADGMGEGDLVIEFEGEGNVDWSVQLVESKGKRVNRVVSIVVENGSGELTLEGYGDEEVMLVVSPLIWRENEYEYSWTANLVVAPEDTGTDSPTGDGAGESEGEGGAVDVGAGACGCASGGSGAAGLVPAVALAGLLRRRAPKNSQSPSLPMSSGRWCARGDLNPHGD